MALIEPQNVTKPPNAKIFISENYESTVNQSIESLLDSLQNPNTDLSVFASTFLELMKAKPHPPLEIIWFFSGLTFHSNHSPKDDILDKLSALKDLFQLITACSASCSSLISIALTAPVIFELHRALVDLKGKSLGLKREKKVKREITSFIDSILGYFNVCCCEGSNGDGDLSLHRPLIELVSIWVKDNGIGRNAAEKDGLKLFFPMLSDAIIELISEENCGVNELAGAVIMEAFLLKLCLKLSDGSSRKEQQDELRTWAVCSITGFHSFYFFDMLVKMLLEPHLTVMSLLSSEDESFLRKVLYDAVILPNYSFLHLDAMAHLPINHIKDGILATLMVTHEAIELYRKVGDHAKAISYINAFSGSHFPALIIKLVTSEIGIAGRTSQSNGSSPTAFLKWVLNLQDQGVRLSSDFMSKHYTRSIVDNLKSDFDQLEMGKTDKDVVFFIDNKGKSEDDEEEKINESMNDAFVSAAHKMQSDKNRKKRKETKSLEKKKTKVKYQRYDFVDHSSSKSSKKAKLFDKDGSRSASDVENPDLDEDSD